MSLYKTTINNFIHLLITQSLLFSEQDKLELDQLIANQPDDIKSLSNAISNWCSTHHQIDDSLADLEELHPNSKAPGLDKANYNIPEYQTDKRTLLNSIQQSSYSHKNRGKKTGNT